VTRQLNQIVKDSQSNGFLTALELFNNNTATETDTATNTATDGTVAVTEAGSVNRRLVMFTEGEMQADAAAATLQRLLARNYEEETAEELLEVSKNASMPNRNVSLLYFYFTPT
jgi:hypothetical protein